MMYAIYDDKGLIHSGTEEEMKEARDIMTRDIYSMSEEEETTEAFNKYAIHWIGELKLMKIIKTTI